MRLRRKRNRRFQYRLRLEGGRCLAYYEVGHQEIRRRGDLILAIYGSHQMAAKYLERYNAEWAWLGLKAEIWAYLGSMPVCPAPEEIPCDPN